MIDIVMKCSGGRRCIFSAPGCRRGCTVFNLHEFNLFFYFKAFANPLLWDPAYFSRTTSSVYDVNRLSIF